MELDACKQETGKGSSHYVTHNPALVVIKLSRHLVNAYLHVHVVVTTLYCTNSLGIHDSTSTVARSLHYRASTQATTRSKSTLKVLRLLIVRMIRVVHV